MITPDSLILHATAVAVNGAGVLIVGASGTGKSSLALEMMARGAELVADDGVILQRMDQTILMTCPETLRGLIEARGVGLLMAHPVAKARLALVVDMDKTENTRMPPDRQTRYLDKTIPMLHNVASQHFPAAVIQYLKSPSRRDLQT
jgi:serine kinase of HPr protein (carbohydrate metabolism regulator)